MTEVQGTAVEHGSDQINAVKLQDAGQNETVITYAADAEEEALAQEERRVAAMPEDDTEGDEQFPLTDAAPPTEETHVEFDALPPETPEI